jgi:hypothetical protein
MFAHFSGTVNTQSQPAFRVSPQRRAYVITIALSPGYGAADNSEYRLQNGDGKLFSLSP